MPEVQLTLDFGCCTCKHKVSVTLKCEGHDPYESNPTVAAVNVPCPTCGGVNQLFFEPNGTIRAVAPCRVPWPLPEPSVN
jgi:hypothetical protein